MTDFTNPRYLVGIDLGTTHCVLSYLDTQAPTTEHQALSIPQLLSPGAIESNTQLPSFLYLHSDAEISSSELSLPWQDAGHTPPNITGKLARSLGTKTPIRLVSSAKSWLCHAGIDPKTPSLPIDAPEDVNKVSPFAASQAYLRHLTQAWDHSFPQHPLVDQQVVLTIPASFDPAARELTAEAASSLGLTQLTLLEEPQAALYSWLQSHEDSWRDQLSVGDVVLVVDIGGGTTDLSLVAVTEEAGALQLNRVAVGDHILLGGDNMDLALAYQINAKLAQQSKQLQPWQIQALTHACRDAKEQLLVPGELNSVAITIPSRGSKLLGSSLRTELTRQEVEQSLIEGFFPQVDINAQPISQARSALTQKGLAYAQDAAITRHLAAFLSRQHAATNQLSGFPTSANAHSRGDFIKPTAILLNGGVLKAPSIEQRLLNIINRWLEQANAKPARLLEGANLDLSVAQGAAYYGRVNLPDENGKTAGVRIHGGTASTYYVGIESSMPAIPGMAAPVQALCVAPFGMKEGASIHLKEREFGLVIGEPVCFQFFGSNSRREDSAGALLDYWQEGELETLPDIQATLPAMDRKAGEVVAVTLKASITPVGTLKLEAMEQSGPGVWNVELTVRETQH